MIICIGDIRHKATHWCSAVPEVFSFLNTTLTCKSLNVYKYMRSFSVFEIFSDHKYWLFGKHRNNCDAGRRTSMLRYADILASLIPSLHIVSVFLTIPHFQSKMNSRLNIQMQIFLVQANFNAHSFVTSSWFHRMGGVIYHPLCVVLLSHFLPLSVSREINGSLLLQKILMNRTFDHSTSFKAHIV